MKNLLLKIQSFPELIRKIILYSVIIILGLGLFNLYIKIVQKRLMDLQLEKLKEELQLPSLEEELRKYQK